MRIAFMTQKNTTALLATDSGAQLSLALLEKAPPPHRLTYLARRFERCPVLLYQPVSVPRLAPPAFSPYTTLLHHGGAGRREAKRGTYAPVV